MSMYPSVTIFQDAAEHPAGELHLAGDCSRHDGYFEGTGPNALQQLEAAFRMHNTLEHNNRARLIPTEPHIHPEGGSSVSGEFEV